MRGTEFAACRSVGLATVEYVEDSYDTGVVVDVVQDAIVADAHAPGPRSTVTEQAAAGWSGIAGKSVYVGDHPLIHLWREMPEVALGRRTEDDAHQASLPSARSWSSNSSRETSSPSSALASSAARRSAMSSSNSRSLSYSSMGRTTAVRRPFSSTRNCFFVRLRAGLTFVSIVLAVYLGPGRSARRIHRWQPAF